MSLKLKPLEDRVVIEPLEGESKSSGGIILPDSSKDKPTKGKVIAVGDGRITKSGQRIEVAVKVKDKILFSQYAGTDVKVGDKEYKILSESEILAILED